MTLAPKMPLFDAPAIHRPAAVNLVRCLCPECLRLDAQHKGEGHQLTFDQYRFADAIQPGRLL